MADGPGVSGRAAAPTPAATVVPLRDGKATLEVLLLRRSSHGAFGGMWVFPGGKVDPADLVGTPDEIEAARRAAVREAREESGLELDVAGLVTLSFWVPPPEAPRRFATWFFLAPTATGAAVTVDDGEIHDHWWVPPDEAMEARQAGEIELAPPTFTTLWWLSQRRSVSEAMASAAAREPERFETHVATGDGGKLIATLWKGDAGYDERDATRPGARRRLVMDPAGWRVEMSD